LLDNCEHLVGAAASMAEALLRTNPAARVITTSREPLRAEGECLYRVPALAVPVEGSQEEDPLAARPVASLGPWWKRTGRLYLGLGALGCCRPITSARARSIRRHSRP
jgi:predicted ATPase